jgi:molecular chaperone DnaK (HSP70)
MVDDADKFKAQDDMIRKTIEAKNNLENYCFTMMKTLNGDLKSHFSYDDKSTIEAAAAGGL